MNIINIGIDPKLIVSSIPGVSVHELTNIGHANVAFISSLTCILNLLAIVYIYSVLANAFIQTAKTFNRFLGV